MRGIARESVYKRGLCTRVYCDCYGCLVYAILRCVCRWFCRVDARGKRNLCELGFYRGPEEMEFRDGCVIEMSIFRIVVE